MIVYGSPLSQPTRAVRILLASSNIDYEFRKVNLRELENKSEWFLKLNPNGLVPVIDGALSRTLKAVQPTYLEEPKGAF